MVTGHGQGESALAFYSEEPGYVWKASSQGRTVLTMFDALRLLYTLVVASYRGKDKSVKVKMPRKH